MTREEAITNLNMISVAYVDVSTKEQRKLIDDTFGMAIKALVNERKTGHWIEHKGINETNYIICSECSAWFLKKEMPRNSYCPNCGAKMEVNNESIFSRN